MWMGTLYLGLGLWPVGVALAGTSDVFKVNGFIKGSIEYLTSTNNNKIEAILDIQINRNNLINLALGNDIAAKVPKNEVLALAADCTLDLKMIVFDTDTSSNLATIGQLVLVDQVSQTDERRRISNFFVPGAGNATNGITGGTLLMYDTLKGNTNNCLKKWTGTMLGVLGTVLPGTNYTLSLTTNIVDAICTNILCCDTNIVGDTTNVMCCTTNIMHGMTNLVGGATNFVDCVLTNIDVIINTNVGPVDINVIIPSTTFKTQGKKIGALIEEP
jgi:hypothetical protein